MSCFGTVSALDLGRRFSDRQVGSTLEPFQYRMEWHMQPFDLSDAVVTFTMVNCVTNEIKIDGGVGNGTADGVASYQPVDINVDTAGLYRCQFVCTSAIAVYRSPMIQQRIRANPDAPPAHLVPTVTLPIVLPPGTPPPTVPTHPIVLPPTP